MISIDEYDTPWKIAIALINAFDINDLKRIAEHLMNYAEVEEHDE